MEGIVTKATHSYLCFIIIMKCTPLAGDSDDNVGTALRGMMTKSTGTTETPLLHELTVGDWVPAHSWVTHYNSPAGFGGTPVTPAHWEAKREDCKIKAQSGQYSENLSQNKKRKGLGMCLSVKVLKFNPQYHKSKPKQNSYTLLSFCLSQTRISDLGQLSILCSSTKIKVF